MSTEQRTTTGELVGWTYCGRQGLTLEVGSEKALRGLVAYMEQGGEVVGLGSTQLTLGLVLELCVTGRVTFGVYCGVVEVGSGELFEWAERLAEQQGETER